MVCTLFAVQQQGGECIHNITVVARLVTLNYLENCKTFEKEMNWA
jgi:hypothetical protein